MLSAVIWGLVQGLTEFLPVSSSGHLVIIPAFLDALGMDVKPPTLAVSAVLHLGTLVAVIIYFRSDLSKVLHMSREPEGRTIAFMVAVGSIPAVIGLAVNGRLQVFQETVSNVGWAVILTGLILAGGQRLATGKRRMADGGFRDAAWVGIAQAVALIPGISRSGITISAGNALKFEPVEAARFSFLLGIPAIAAAGIVEASDLSGTGGLTIDLLVGAVVAGVSGYLAIGFLLKALRTVGLMPFSIYCLAVGTLTVLFL